MKTNRIYSSMKQVIITGVVLLFTWAMSGTVKAQSVVKNPLCYGEPIQFLCNWPQGCNSPGATFHWTNASGSWTSSQRDPVINEGEDGYATDIFYLQIQYSPPPGGFYGGSVHVTVWPEIILTATTTPVSCTPGNDGCISITQVSGGTPPYTLAWSNGATTMSICGLACGQYTVTVTDAHQCQKVQSWKVTTDMNLTATINPLCCTPGNVNGSIDLTVTNGCPPYSYAWSNGVTTQDLTNLLCGNTYCVTVTDVTGCQKTGCYTLNPKPVAFAGPDRTICTGSSTMLGGPPVAGSTYSWTSVPVGFTSTLANPTVSPATTTTYTVTETITATGCTNSNIVTVLVKPMKQLGVSIVASSNPVCPGTPVNFTATTVNGGEGVVTIGTGTSTVGWPFYTFYMGSRTQMLYTAAQLTQAGGTAGVINSIGFNFGSTSSQTMNNFTIKMGATSVSTLSGFVTGLNPVYATNYSVPGTGWRDINLSPSFLWNGTSNVIVEICFGDNGSYTSNSMVFGTVSNQTTWHYHADNYAGCSGTASGAVQTVTPNIRFSFQYANSYQWQVNGVNVGTNSSSFSYTPENNDVITCVVTSSDPCLTGNPATSNVITATQVCCPDFVLKDAVKICPPYPACCDTIKEPGLPLNPPHPSIRCDTIAACKLTPHTYTVFPNSSSYNYTWTVIGGTPATFTGNPITIVWGSGKSGVIKVVIRGIGNYACCKDSIIQKVCLIDGPNAGFTISPVSPVCLKTPVLFTNTCTGGSNYFWEFGDGTSFNTNSANPVSHTYLSPGTYTVQLTVTDMGEGKWEMIVGPNGALIETKVPCGCIDTITKQIVVDPKQGPEIIYHCCTECKEGTVCPGDTSSFCTTVTCSNYFWSVSGGQILYGPDPRCIKVNWDQVYTNETKVTLTTQGCSLCDGSTTLMVPVLYSDLPISGLRTLCVGSSASYSLPSMPGTYYNWSVTSTPPAGIYVFNKDDRNVSTVNLTFQSVGTYFVKCEYNNPMAGCPPGMDTIAVHVLPPFIFDFGNETVCEGSTTYYQVNGNATWAVAPAGPTLMPLGNSSYMGVLWSNPGTYTLTATNTQPGVFCNPDAVRVVQVLANPVLSAIDGPGQFCPGKSYTYYITSDTPGYDFNWSIPGATLVSAMGAYNDSVVVQWGTSNSYTITVSQTITPYGCTSYTSKTVTKFPVPTIVSGPQTVCIDDLATYTAGPGNPPGGLQWMITPDTQGTITAGQGTGTITVMWHGPAGSATVTLTSCAGSGAPYPVTVNGPGTVTATFSKTPVFCAGISDFLTLTATYGAGYTYKWFKTGTGFINGATNVSYTFNTSTLSIGTHQYYAEVTLNGCSVNTNLINVVVEDCSPGGPGNCNCNGNPCPNVAFFRAYALCDEIKLVEKSVINSPGTLSGYQWTVSPPGTFNPPAGNVQNPTLTVSASGTYTITLTVTSTSCTTSHSETVNVLLPIANLSCPSSVCPDVSSVFAASPTGSNFQYAWSFGDGALSYDPGPKHSYANTTALTLFRPVALTIVDDLGCVAQNSTMVQVHPKPGCTISTPHTSFCPGHYETLTANCASTGYQWFKDSLAIAGATNSTYNVHHHGEYWVEVTNIYGCTGRSASIYMFLKQQPKAKISITGKSPFCAFKNLPFSFNLESIHGINYVYDWSSDGTATFSNNGTHAGQTTTATVMMPATLPVTYYFMVKVTDSPPGNGCEAYDTICITFYEKPVLTVQSMPGLNICEGTPVTLTPDPNDPGIFEYQWNNGKSIPVIVVEAPGFYSLTITDKESGCTADADAGFIFPKPDLSLYPVGCDTICDTATFHTYIPLPLNALPPLNTYGNAYQEINWYDNGVYINQGENLAYINTYPQFLPAPGDHRISVTVKNFFGCSKTSDLFCLHVKNCSGCFAEIDPLFEKIMSDITYTADKVWDGKYYIDDYKTVTVDGALLDITNVDVVFGPCAGIRFINGGYLRANNSVFRPCDIDSTWRGLCFSGNGKFDNIINESTFKNAEVALCFDSAADAVISNNLFSNCNYGIRVCSNNNFNHPISGNQFVTDEFFPTFINCHGFINNYSTYGIYALSSRFLYQLAQNGFVNSKGGNLRTYGIYQMSGGGILSENKFTDLYSPVFMQSQRFYSIAENNEIEMNIPANTWPAIYIVSCKGPVVEVNNNEIWNNYNQFTGGYGVYATNSSNVSIVNNKIDGFKYGIVSNVNTKSQISNNEINDCKTTGIYVLEQTGNRNYTTCNTIKMKNFINTRGLSGYGMSAQSEVSSNCITDCYVSMDFLRWGSGSTYPPLPKIRNNFLYNYSAVGVNVQDLSGNIGTLTDPGLNTLWSNKNSAIDINSNRTITVADNFGMFNIAWPYVQITSNRPWHSTASCALQIFNLPSQGQLNVNYICDHYQSQTLPLTGTGGNFRLSPDYRELLGSSQDQFNDANMILSVYTFANQSLLDEIIGLTTLTEGEKSLLRYNYHYRKGNAGDARLYLNRFSPVNTEEADYKTLRLVDLDVAEKGFETLSGNDIETLKNIRDKKPDLANFAIALLNNSPLYTDYKIEELPSDEVQISGEIKHISQDESYLHIYPNPFTNTIFVELINNTEDLCKVELFDVVGNRVGEYEVSFVAGGMALDVHRLKEGMYILVLTNPASGFIQKGKMIKINH